MLFAVRRDFDYFGIDAIVKFQPHEKGRLIVELYPAAQEGVVENQERAALLKQRGIISFLAHHCM